MKIAYFTESLPPLVDGVTRTLCNLVNTLEKGSISYRFFAPVKPESDVAWRDKVHKVASAPFFLYKYYRIGLPYFNGIDRQLDSFKPDVVHVVSPTLLGLYGIQYAHKNKIPVVASYHTHFVSYFNYYGFSQMEQIGWSYLSWFHNKCARTFTPSASAMRELRQNGVQEVELWPHGVELDRFSPDHRSAALRQSIGAENKPLLLFVGRLVKEKDLDDLAAASELLRERGHDFALAFVGDGPMKQELQTRLPFAHFAGHQHGGDLARWYASADIFVFPSTTETFGNVIPESFASGVPAVGVAQGGVGDLIMPGVNGLLTRPKSPVDFAATIQVLLDDPSYRAFLGKQARQTVQNASWDAINRRLFSSYEQIITSYN